MIKIIRPDFKLNKDDLVIDTTSRSNNWSAGLSPFFLGPVKLYDSFTSQTMESGWQYSKLYPEFANDNNEPLPSYFEWALEGWSNPRAERYPMGKNSKPLGTWWKDKLLSYTEARRKIYVPMYKWCVQKTEAFQKLKQVYESKGDHILYLIDFDSHNLEPNMNDYEKLWSNPKIKVGHGYVLAAMLEKCI